MKLLSTLEKSKACWLLLIILISFFFLRLPSLFEPIWYGDEGIYQVIGKALGEGRLLYKDIWDNKPPLLYITHAILGADQFTLRLTSLLVGLVAIVAFFFLSKRLFYPSHRVPLVATSIFAFFFGTPLLEGNIANAENFILPLGITAAFLMTSPTLSKKPHLLFVSGFLLSIAFHYKIVAVFDTAALLLFFFFFKKDEASFPKKLAGIFPFVVGFITPLLVTALYFVTTGTFVDFYRASFTQMVGYVGYGNSFVIGQGFLILKGLLVFFFLVGLFVNRKKLTSSALFILVWFAFSLFNAFFAQRPYTHYLLVLLPAFTLFSTLIGTTFFMKHTSSTLRLLGSITVIGVLLLCTNNFHVYKKTARYYGNFFSFLFFGKSVHDYQAFFDRNTPRDYELAQFINARKKQNDTLFVWGNNAQLYTLTNTLPPGRFTVMYHMIATPETLQETATIVQKTRPSFIVVTNPKHPIPFILSGYSQTFSIKGSLIYEKVL